MLVINKPLHTDKVMCLRKSKEHYFNREKQLFYMVTGVITVL